MFNRGDHRSPGGDGPAGGDRNREPAQARTLVQELAAACRAIDVETLTIAERAELIEGLADLRRATDATEVCALIEVAKSDQARRHAGHRSTRWHANLNGTTSGFAKKRHVIATKLDTWFPVLLAAFRSGEISLDHCDAVCSVTHPAIAQHLVDLQADLIVLAQHMTCERFRLELRLLAAALDEDGPFDPDGAMPRSRLRIRPDLDGIVFDGTMTGSDALAFSEAIARKTAQLFARAVRDHAENGVEMPASADLKGQALLELVLLGSSADPAAGNAPVRELTIVINRDAPATATDVDHTVEIGGGDLARCTCDSAVRTAEIDQFGEVLSLGRLRRLASAAQRHAAHLRDGGCVFPGCDAPVGWTELHHVVHWQDGGPTDLENLACLCRFHHSVTHQDGWSMRRRANAPPGKPPGLFEWSTPTGLTLRSQHHAPTETMRLR